MPPGSLVPIGGRVAPRLASKMLTRRVLFTPITTQPSDRAREILDQACTETEVVDGDSVVLYRWGDGERRVLLVHGWSGNAGHMTALAEALVAAGFTAVAMDLPGHGRSEGTRSSVVHFARAIEAARRRYGDFHAVVAHSLGAAATAYALSRGLGCARAVFFNPLASYEGMWRRTQVRLGASPLFIQSAVKHAERWLGVSFPDIEPTALAPRLSCRLLVIHDTHDPETPISESAALVEAWPDAELVTVEKMGHTRVLRSDDLVQRAVDLVAAPESKSSATPHPVSGSHA